MMVEGETLLITLITEIIGYVKKKEAISLFIYFV